MLGKSRPHNTPKSPAVQKIAGRVLTLLTFLALASCVTPSPIERQILKEVVIQFDPTGSPLPIEEVGKLLFATQGAIEAQLPVRITVLNPQFNPDNSSACVVRFAPWIDLFSLGYNIEVGSTGAVQWNGKAVYPCTILLRNDVTDLQNLRTLLQHELGHAILNQEHHSDDPLSIMYRGVAARHFHGFTAEDSQRLLSDRPLQ